MVTVVRSPIAGQPRKNRKLFFKTESLKGCTRSAFDALRLLPPVYNALPSGSIPTDTGALATVITCSANARAVGLLPPVPDPQGEMPTIGAPPAFAINSAVPFDFDPTKPIDPGRAT
jgi:hypothetical protein